MIMSMKKLKVGILGCGKMGKVYADWFSANPHCEVTALFNRTFETAVDLAKNYKNSTAKRQWTEIVNDPDIDIIGICTPSHQHLEQLEGSVKAGKHVLCEKPMARDYAESVQMHKIAESASVKVAIGFQMRFHPVVQKIDECLDQIGEVLHIDLEFGMYRPEITWRHQRVQGGGVLKELGTHLIDLACHWVGDISSVTAFNKIFSPSRQVEDYSLNLLEFSSGISGYILCNYYDQRNRVISGNIIGNQGQLSWQFSSYDQDDARLIFYEDSLSQEVALSIPKEIDRVYPGHLDSFKKEIDHFVSCILNDKQPRTGTLEGLKSMAIVDASYRSTKEHKSVSPKK